MATDWQELCAKRMARTLNGKPRRAKTRAYLKTLPKRAKVTVNPEEFAVARVKLKLPTETPSVPAAKTRKDRLRPKTWFKPMENDLAAPYLPPIVAAPRATSGLTATHHKVWDRCGGLCHYCGRAMVRMPNDRLSFTLDHVIPRSRGGSNHLSNLVGSCAECNGDKGSLTGEEYEAVLAVRKRNRTPHSAGVRQ
jgi:5-methylcytosine-specific restriction endonuclease McrA